MSIVFVFILSYFKHPQYPFSSQFSMTFSCNKNSSYVLEKRKACPFRVSVMAVRNVSHESLSFIHSQYKGRHAELIETVNVHIRILIESFCFSLSRAPTFAHKRSHSSYPINPDPSKCVRRTVLFILNKFSLKIDVIFPSETLETYTIHMITRRQNQEENTR
jgi:hypothetical protein